MNDAMRPAGRFLAGLALCALAVLAFWDVPRSGPTASDDLTYERAVLEGRIGAFSAELAAGSGRFHHYLHVGLTSLAYRMDSLPLRLPYPVDPALAKIGRQVAQTPDNSRTLEDWATRLGMHPKTLQRRFLRETGLTFGQWRQQACLIQAFEKLAAGEKVVDVALALGYNSPTAFASMFRRHLGVPPSAYFGQRSSRTGSK